MEQTAISIDLGGSHATIAAVHGAKLLASREVALDHAQDLRPVLDVFATSITQLLDELRLKPQECQGIALGFCGLADARTGRVISTNKKYEDAPGIDFRAWSQQTFGLPFAIENDARMALLGERYAGAARGYDDVVMITLGTGVGGAAMIEGKLLRGKHAQAGCLGGHLPAKVGGRACTCGAIGCIEAEASGWALPLIAKDWTWLSRKPIGAKGGDRFSCGVRVGEGGRQSLKPDSRLLPGSLGDRGGRTDPRLRSGADRYRRWRDAQCRCDSAVHSTVHRSACVDTVGQGEDLPRRNSAIMPGCSAPRRY